MTGSIAPVVLLMALLAACSGGGEQPGRGPAASPMPPVPVAAVGRDRIRITPESEFASRLDVVPVRAAETSSPRLTVTGSVVARLPGGKTGTSGSWDFSDPQVAAAYAEWLRAETDAPFAKQQLEKTRELAKARIAAQSEVVARLRKLVGIGSDPQKDLASAQADLLQSELESQRQVFEAESAWRTAEAARTTLQRQLFQAGVPPDILATANGDTAIVVGEVPERALGSVRGGEPCLLRFVALPGDALEGKVAAVAPSLTSERRTLRVFFAIADPGGRLRPGMFAEVSLDTTPRTALLVPADAIVHLGRDDYVVARSGPSEWRVVKVDVGNVDGADLEILSGLAPTDSVVGRGAVLLKPVVQQALTFRSAGDATTAR